MIYMIKIVNREADVFLMDRQAEAFCGVYPLLRSAAKHTAMLLRTKHLR
jgi:hypothetical protein